MSSKPKRNCIYFGIQIKRKRKVKIHKKLQGLFFFSFKFMIDFFMFKKCIHTTFISCFAVNLTHTFLLGTRSVKNE